MSFDNKIKLASELKNPFFLKHQSDINEELQKQVNILNKRKYNVLLASKILNNYFNYKQKQGWAVPIPMEDFLLAINTALYLSSYQVDIYPITESELETSILKYRYSKK